MIAAMDLDGIAIFVKVIQAGSFSQAAKLLGMPNSTVSAKVSALEQRLGVTLLQRTTRKLRATQAGEAYFQRSVRALEELQAAENELETGRAEAQRTPAPNGARGNRPQSLACSGPRVSEKTSAHGGRADRHQPRARSRRRWHRPGYSRRPIERLQPHRQEDSISVTSGCGQVPNT